MDSYKISVLYRDYLVPVYRHHFLFGMTAPSPPRYGVQDNHGSMSVKSLSHYSRHVL